MTKPQLPNLQQTLANTILTDSSRYVSVQSLHFVHFEKFCCCFTRIWLLNNNVFPGLLTDKSRNLTGGSDVSDSSHIETDNTQLASEFSSEKFALEVKNQEF